MQKAEFIEKYAIVSDPRLRDKLLQQGFGELKERKLLLDWLETAYLLEKGTVEVYAKDKKLSYEEIIEQIEERNKLLKYFVYRDLRSKGFVVKSALKFGFDLRVYPKGKRPGEAHTKYVVSIWHEDSKMDASDITKAVRLSKTLNTEFLIAFVDNEGNINYYKIERMKI